MRLPKIIFLLNISSLASLAIAQSTVHNASELNNAINRATGGETIFVADGNYGELSILGRDMPETVSIVAVRDAAAKFSRITVEKCSGWRLSGVVIQPRIKSGADGKNAVSLSGTNVVFEYSTINYADNALDWTKKDWLDRTGNGISLNGKNISVIGNTIQYVDHAIGSSATHSRIARNKISFFRGDACRSLGDYVVFEYNTAKNAVNVDENHDDFFQSWSTGPRGVGTSEVTGVTIRGNTFISYEDRQQAFATQPNGIGLFDGMYRDWKIENNLIITGHWHGISIYGGINCRIVNNTVVDRDASDTMSPWIKIVDHKNKTPSSQSVVRNNIATAIKKDSGVVADHNLVVKSQRKHFIDPDAFDFRLAKSNRAIYKGNPNLAPDIDKNGIARKADGNVTIGAFE